MGKTKVLERFGVSMDAQSNMTNEEMLTLLTGMLNKQRCLDYIGFDVGYDSFVNVTDIINTALSSTQKIHRSEFKIGLNVTNCPRNMVEIANIAICQTIDVLNRCNIESYMVDMAFYAQNASDHRKNGVVAQSIDDKRKRQQMMRALKRTHLVSCKPHPDGISIRFVVQIKSVKSMDIGQNGYCTIK